MAGIGVDAMIMDETDDTLKDEVRARPPSSWPPVKRSADCQSG